MKSAFLTRSVSLSRARVFSFLTALFSSCFPAPAHSQPDSGYEIIAHRASIQLAPSSNSISCIDTVSIRLAAKRPEQIALNFFPWYEIKTVTLNGNEIRYKRSGNVVSLDNLPTSQQFDIILSYGTRRAFHTETTFMTPTRAILREEDLLPYGPRSLEFVRLQLTVPKEWTTITVGQLVEKEVKENTATHVWEAREPMPMIGAILAGQYWSMEDSGVSVHLYEEDSASAGRILTLAKDVLRFYSKRFSPYRFPKLAIVEMEDWIGGPNILAVAVPSMVMVKHLAFTTDDAFNRAESILPHEIAHQWWPATVYVDPQDLPFLAEGMCEYSSILFHESTGTKTIRDSLNHHPFLRPLITRLLKGKDVPLQQPTDMRSLYTHYLKASYVHHMLRRAVGDSVFFRLYREFAHRYSAQKVGLDEFRKLADELSGMDLRWFFDQWVRKSGVPRLKIYNVKFAQQGNIWNVQGRVRIVGYDKFTAMVDVGVETPSGMKKERVRLGVDSAGRYHNDVAFEVRTDEAPLRVVLDPDGDVLNIRRLPAKFSDLREPVDGIFIVGTLQHSDYLYGLAQRDSVELTGRGWGVRIMRDTSITLAHLQSEKVFIYGGVGENRVAAELQAKFPMKLTGGGMTIKGEVVTDSTLALMQVIENPFNAQGLLSWVTPFSENAQPLLAFFDASWVLVRGKDEIATGTWETIDADLVVERH